MSIAQKTSHYRGYAALAVTFVGLCASSLWSKPKPDHYCFILPPNYIGWVQIVFAVPGAPGLPLTGDSHALQVRIGESGVVKTGGYRVHFPRPRDEFFYERRGPDGHEKLVPVPDSYLLDDGHNTYGGFGVNGTPDNSPGYSWFFFVGPPEVRDRTPWADIRKVPGFGEKLQAPATYPKPGRMPQPDSPN